MDRADREQRNARIVELYFEKHQSREEIAHLIGLSYAHVCRIIKAAAEGVKPRCSLTGGMYKYSYSLKKQAVEMALTGNFTRAQIAAELGVCAPAKVSQWVTIARKDGMEALMSKHEQMERNYERQKRLKEIHEEVSDLTTKELKEEIERLRLENAILEETIAIIKKDPGVDASNLSNAEKVQVIDALYNKGFKLSSLLARFGLAKSAYYYQKQAQQRPDKYAKLRVRIREIFLASNATYGSERIWATLKRGDVAHAPQTVSEKVVRRLMCEEGLVVIHTKKQRHYNSYRGEFQASRPQNLVKKNFHAGAPNKLWLTDITQFTLRDFKCYLSPIIDCYDGMVVSYRLSLSPDQGCVLGMLNDAISTLKDGEHPILHSDGGIHYWWRQWKDTCDAAGITRSMSKKACSPDNSACEGFFGRMKNEMYYYRNMDDLTFPQFKELVAHYINWYNNDRIKESLGWLSPTGYRLEQGLAA